MRKPRGKLVALLAGAVAIPLLTLAVLFWKDVYCHLFLDPELVGRWKSEAHPVPDVVLPGPELKFDKVGNVWSTAFKPFGTRPEFYLDIREGTYRIDGDSLIGTLQENGETTYRIEEDTLTFGSSDITYRRVPDDSGGMGAAFEAAGSD